MSYKLVGAVLIGLGAWHLNQQSKKSDLVKSTETGIDKVYPYLLLGFGFYYFQGGKPLFKLF